MKELSVQALEHAVYECVDDLDEEEFASLYNFLFGKRVVYNKEKDIYEVEEE